MSLPFISVITPSYNQSNFIEETIKSVIFQGYSRFEHIIVDGFSSDSTLEILSKYHHLKVISEKDNGQSEALNKGFRIAVGDIVAWINSDDTYEPGTFTAVGQYFEEHPNCNVVFGDFSIIDINSKKLKYVHCKEFTLKQLLQKGNSLIGQPSVFFRKIVLERIGYIDESLHLGMDYDFFIRLRMKYEFRYIPLCLSNFRKHTNSKTIDGTKKDINIGFAISKKYNGGKYSMLYINIIIRKIYYLYPSLGHTFNYFRYRIAGKKI